MFSLVVGIGVSSGCVTPERVATIAQAGGTPCTDGAVNALDDATGHCYMLFTDSLLWAEASQACAALDGDTHLAILDDPNKNDRVMDMMGDIGVSNAWLDGTDAAVEMDWRWSTTGAAVPSEGWAFGNPGDPFGVDDCMVLRPFQDGWTDERCNSRREYVCEREAVREPDAGVPDPRPDAFGGGGGTPASCSQGDFNAIDSSTSTCYMYFDTRNQWSSSVTFCQTLGAGAHFVDILSESDNRFLASGWAPPGRVWLGANDVMEEMTWQWITGEPMVYDNWGPGEPDDSGPRGEDCLVADITPGGDATWLDVPCDDQLPVICERGDLGGDPDNPDDTQSSLYGCTLTSGAGAGSLWLLGLALVIARRRRRGRSVPSPARS